MCLLPVVLCTESLAFFHLEVNPRRRETAGEASQCSQTPAHPERKVIITPSAIMIIEVLQKINSLCHDYYSCPIHLKRGALSYPVKTFQCFSSLSV